MKSNLVMQVEQLNLSRQLKQYIISAEEMITKLISVSNYCRALSDKQSPFRQIQVMQHRLNLEIQKYKQTINKLENRVINNGGIKNLKNYFTNNYQTLTREAHQLMSMCGNQIKLPKQQDFKKIKRFQEEMDEQWQKGNPNNSTNLRKKQASRYIYTNTFQIPTVSSQIESNQRKAQAQIQQQFLAIRMIAYRMYQKHNGHHHQKLHQQVQLLQQEQEKLKKQLIQMQQIRLNLLGQQNKLQAELNELKKINELVGRRYFIQQGTQ